MNKLHTRHVCGIMTSVPEIKPWRSTAGDKTVAISIINEPFSLHPSVSASLKDTDWYISVFNQIDAQNWFHNKFYFMPLHVSSTCAHHQEVKIALHSLWYHHTYRCDDTRDITQPLVS